MQSHMTDIHWSIVWGIKIWEHCKVYSLLDVNNIYSMSFYMYNYVTVEFICAQDDIIRNSVTWYQKGVLMPSA